MAIDWGFTVITRTEMSPSLLRPAVYPHAKADAAFGYVPRYRLPDAIAEMRRLYKGS